MLARLIAFTSKALFSDAACVGACAPFFFPFSLETGRCFGIKLGSCVMGFIEPSSGDSKSAQLVGWDTCSIETWRATSPNTVPAGWDLNMDAVYCTPQLSGENFHYMRLPRVL